MTTKELLNKSYEENQELFQKALRKIKPFSGYVNQDVPMCKLEKYIGLVERKYAIMINYICPTFIPKEKNVWCATIKYTDTGEIKEYIYGTTIYELFCKICILYYSQIKNGLELKNWDKYKEEKLNKLKEIRRGIKSIY